jgi:fatty-acyl-CoA synthase
MTSIRARSRALSSSAEADGESSRLQRFTSTLQSNADRGSVELSPTPTRNTLLPFRRGGFGSLCEALDYAGKGETGLNFFDARGRLLERLPYADLRTKALRFARRLIGGGFARGERLVIVADTWPGFCVAFFGAQYAGVLPVPVAVPAGIGAKASYIRQLRRQILSAGAAAVVAPDDLADFAVEAATGTWARLAGPMSLIEALPEHAGDLQPLGRGQRCYVQFSSGSTRAPLGVDVCQDQLMANIDGSIARQELDADDSGVSWLPFYHDMGLIGFVLAPLCAQRSVDLLAPREFARRPMQWLSLISRRRATITYSPSFGYDLVARRVRQPMPEAIDLSCLKLAGVGADMIQPAVLRRFADAFAACGFDSRAFLPSYGMAEVCVGLTFGRRFSGVRTDLRDGREFVSCGQVMDGHHVQIRGESGFALGEGHVGRIFAQGPSVMPGYFLKTEETQQVLRDGWLDTGDLGYWRDGELVVTGRAKDLIIVNGRNIWPQDIEWAVERLPRLRRGDACAFSVGGDEREEVVVLVQGEPAEMADRDELTASVHQVVREQAGVDCRVVLIPRRPGLPVTSSGKLSRARARANYLAEAPAGL